MKKAIITAVVSMISVQLFALPAQVIFDAYSGNAQFYENTGWTSVDRAVDGWYAEIILQNGVAAYNELDFDSYAIAGVDYGEYSPGYPSHQTGLRADGVTTLGTTTRDGKSEIVWQFTETSISSWYATWRVYNNADKNLASKYAVLGWQALGTAPGDPAPTPVTLYWITSDTRAQMTYDVPAIPEPTTMALFGLGGLALMIRRKLRKEV